MSKNIPIPSQVIYACAGSKCQKRGGKEIRKIMRDRLKMAGRKDEVEIVKTECTDRCKHGPIFCLQPQNIWLHDMTDAQILAVFQEEISNRKL